MSASVPGKSAPLPTAGIDSPEDECPSGGDADQAIRHVTADPDETMAVTDAMEPRAVRILLAILMATAVLLVIGYAGNNYHKMKERAEAREATANTSPTYTEAQFRQAQIERLRGLVRGNSLAEVIDRAKLVTVDRWQLFNGAVVEGRADVAAALLNLGYDPAGGTARYVASYVGPVDEPEIQFHLNSACASGYTDVVKVLLAARADIARPDCLGISPLAAAARLGHADTVAFLLGRGAAVDQVVRLPPITRDEPSADENHVRRLDGMTPLMLAAESRHPDVVKLLIDHGADVRHKAVDGTDAFSACRRGPPLSTTGDRAVEDAAVRAERYRKIEAKVTSRTSVSAVERLLLSRLKSSPH